MADSRIDELTDIGALASGDKFVVTDATDAGTDKYVDVDEVADFVVLDEDSMTTDSAVKAPSQQSTVAYVATELAAYTADTDANVAANSWVVDEDTMSSNSATQVPTQQSVKAYVDAQDALQDGLSELTDVTFTSPAKGKLLVFNGADWVDQPTGSNGQVLEADSADATGIKWATPATGGDMLASTYDAATVAEQLVGLTATQTLTNKTLTQPTVILTQGTSVTPTAEGEIQWDTDGNQVRIGDGAATLTFSDDTVVQARANHTGTQAMATISDAGALATADTVGPSEIAAAAVAFDKMQDVATNVILGRDTAGAGDVEELTVSGGVELNGSGVLQTSALTGDVTKALGGTALTIAAAAVDMAMIQDITTDSFVGRTAAGTGVPEVLSAAQARTVLNVEDNADATDATNVVAGLNAATIPDAGTPVATDQVLIMDASTGTLQSADFSDFDGAAGDMAAATYDAAEVAEQLVGLTASQTLSNKTFVSPALGTPASGVATNLTGTAAGLTVGATTGVEAGADVTDTANVTSAGALMDSEVDADLKTLSLPASTTITVAAATVLDDASVSAMVATLGGAASTGSGGIVRTTSPSLVTPALGTPSALVATNATGTAAGLTVGATTGVAAGADVTDATNVAAAGAAMTDAVITSAAGSAGAPGFTFNGDSNTGTYSVGANSLGISTGGTVRRTISDTVETTTLPQRAASAAASAPAYSFTSDTDTGMYLNGAGNLAFSVGNGTRRTITATAETFTMKNQGPNGSNTAPTYSFSGDTDCGMYQRTAGEVNLTGAGKEQVRVSGSHIIMLDPTYVITDSHSSMNLRQAVATDPVYAATSYVAFQNSAGSRMGYMGAVGGTMYMNNDTGGAWIRILTSGIIEVGKDNNTEANRLYGTDWRLPDITTSTNAANTRISTTNKTFKYISSKGEYKSERAVVPLSDAVKLFDVDPISWISTAPGDIDDPIDGTNRSVGWVAENFAEAGLDQLVDFDADGAAVGISYERTPAYMMVLLQEMWNTLYPDDQRDFPNNPDHQAGE